MSKEPNLPSFIRDLKTKRTANAWWRDKKKLYGFLQDVYEGSSVGKACERFSISPRQYKYFNRQNPEIMRAVRESINERRIAAAKNTIDAAIQNDPKFALRFIEKVSPESLSIKPPQKVPEQKSKVQAPIPRPTLTPPPQPRSLWKRLI